MPGGAPDKLRNTGQAGQLRLNVKLSTMPSRSKTKVVWKLTRPCGTSVMPVQV
jgi:hypothetical protein